MHVVNTHAHVHWKRFEHVIDNPKRIVRGWHEYTPHHIEHCDFRVLHFPDPVSTARRVGRIVCRTNEARLFADVFNRFFLIKDVIAGGHHVDAGRKQLFAQGGCDGKTASEIFGVHDGEIDVVLLAQVLDTLEHSNAPGLSNDISNHEDFHKTRIKNREPWIDNRADQSSRFAIHDSRFLAGGRSASAAPKP